MNKLLIISILFLSFNGMAQDEEYFAIPIKNHPFFNVIEWKGKGGILMSRSPKEFMNQTDCSLIGELREAVWDQKINPRLRDPYYISNENQKYIYFLNNLDPVDNGEASFNQLSTGGSIRSKIINIGIKVKRMNNEVDYNSFELLDAAITERALVYHFRCYDKKEKEYHEYATFMTHHNLALYVFELGHYFAGSKKKARTAGQWNFAGSIGEKIYFAWYNEKMDLPGWTVRGFSPKGELLEDLFLNRPKEAVPFTGIGFGPTGKTYLEDEDRFVREYGNINVINDEFYLTNPEKRNGEMVLVLRKLMEDQETWEEITTTEACELNSEVPLKFGTYALNEGIAFHLDHNGTNEAGLIYFDKEKEVSRRPYHKHISSNLSSLFFDRKDKIFITRLGDGKILTCDRDQFSRNAGISFLHEEGEDVSQDQ